MSAADQNPAWALLLVVVIIVPLLDVGACIFLFRLWRRSAAPRSWLLLLLTTTSTVITIAAGYFGFLASRRLLGLEAYDWTAPISALVIAALGMVPLAKAVVFWRHRRRAGRPPPFAEGD